MRAPTQGGRQVGPFEYHRPFEDVIEASTEQPRLGSRELILVADDLDLDARQVREYTSGAVQNPLAACAEDSARLARDLAQKGLFAAGCISWWADGVGWFNEEVAKLNRKVMSVPPRVFEWRVGWLDR